MLAGYSGTQLYKKLGLKPGWRVFVHDMPDGYPGWISPVPENVIFEDAPSADTDMIHLFVAERAKMEDRLTTFRQLVKSDVVVWVSWPKKAAKVPTDITEDTIRAVALPMGWVDIKVCAVSDIWSGLKLMIRKELRQV